MLGSSQLFSLPLTPIFWLKEIIPSLGKSHDWPIHIKWAITRLIYRKLYDKCVNCKTIGGYRGDEVTDGIPAPGGRWLRVPCPGRSPSISTPWCPVGFCSTSHRSWLSVALVLTCAFSLLPRTCPLQGQGHLWCLPLMPSGYAWCIVGVLID